MNPDNYMVFGFHADNDQRFTTTLEANSHEEAEELAFSETDSPSTLRICGSVNLRTRECDDRYDLRRRS